MADFRSSPLENAVREQILYSPGNCLQHLFVFGFFLSSAASVASLKYTHTHTPQLDMALVTTATKSQTYLLALGL